MDIIGSVLARNGINALKASGGAGYTASQKVEILAEITVPILDEETGEYEIILSQPLNVGWYEFRINGVSHLAFISNVDGCAIGANVEETANEAYYGEYGDGVIYLGFVDGRAPDTITFAIWQETETIHPIDPKYLPGVCLPVVEIADFNAITETESSAISAAAEKKMPCVFVNTNPAAYMAAVLVFAEGDGTQQYALPGAFAVIRDNATGLWAIGTATLGV